MRRDDPRVACGSISHVRCAGDFCPLSQAHLQHKEKRGGKKDSLIAVRPTIIVQLYYSWWLTVNHHFIVTRSHFPDILTCATPSSQPLMTSFRPMVNLKGLFLSREESNFFPFCSVPATNSYNHSQKSWLKQGLLITDQVFIFSTISHHAHPFPRSWSLGTGHSRSKSAELLWQRFSSGSWFSSSSPNEMWLVGHLSCFSGLFLSLSRPLLPYI